MARKRPPVSARSRRAPSRAARLLAEALETRDVPSTLEVQLIPEFDLFGNQYATIQVYDNGDGLGPR
ncbi:MAG TPA: hypothetical protein VM529_23630, partial [Gemmata sp.]|nr:hypothetical protein [Gemmata sp.]